MTRFTPVGHTRDLAVTRLRLLIEALARGDAPLPPRFSSRCRPARWTIPPPPPRSASASQPACSAAGCPAAARTHPAASASAWSCRPGTGPASAPPPASWPRRHRHVGPRPGPYRGLL